MKKFYLLITICFLAIIFTGCTYKKTVEDNTANIIQDEEQVEKDFFEQKLSCSEKTNDIKKYIKEYNQNENYREDFEEIFYSPSLNTCCYVSNNSMKFDDSFFITSYDIWDALTQENLYSFNLLDYDENYLKNDILYLRAVNYTRNQVLKSKLDELKK